MPRNYEEVLADAEALADRFEAGHINGTPVDATPLRQLRSAITTEPPNLELVASAVDAARVAGLPWPTIAHFLRSLGSR